MNSNEGRPCPMGEQTVGWALHALEPEEEFEVVAHLAECEDCRRIAADVAGVTSELAAALPQHEPPPGLRASIVEQARQVPQTHRGGDERPVPGDRLGPPAQPDRRHGRPASPPAPASQTARPPAHARPSHPTGGDGRPPAGPGRTRGGRRRMRQLLVAAVAVVAVLAGGGILAGELQSLRAERDASLAQAQQMEGVLAALARPGVEHAFLAPQPDAPAVAAVLVEDGRREIVPMGLAPNRVDEQTYVLWGLNGDADPTAVGTFDVRSAVSGPLSVASPGSGTFETYAVSLERGREAPPAPSAVTASGQVET